MQLPRVTILTGGHTLEYKSSLDSAAGILGFHEALGSEYCFQVCFVTNEGIWLDFETSATIMDRYIIAGSQGSYEEIIRIAKRGHSTPSQILATTDVIFPAICGAFGEDGTIAGLCQAYRNPCIGDSALTNAVQYDKIMCNAVLAQAGIPQTPQVVILPDEDPDPDVMKSLPLPWFVKPADGGCSIGISRIDSIHLLPAALLKSRHFYPSSPSLVETAVSDALEIDVMVMRDNTGNLLVTPCGLFVSPLSKESKSPKISPLHVPAPGVPAEDAAKMQALTRKLYRVLRVSGWLKVDFFYNPSTRKILVNEVNTLLNMSRGSMMFRLWEAAGVPPVELIRRVVKMALDRGRDSSEWERNRALQKTLVGQGRIKVE
jgi:D-alanine-D-alanine ligase